MGKPDKHNLFKKDEIFTNLDKKSSPSIKVLPRVQSRNMGLKSKPIILIFGFTTLCGIGDAVRYV